MPARRSQQEAPQGLAGRIAHMLDKRLLKIPAAMVCSHYLMCQRLSWNTELGGNVLHVDASEVGKPGLMAKIFGWLGSLFG